jgi:hypothetical protein
MAPDDGERLLIDARGLGEAWGGEMSKRAPILDPGRTARAAAIRRDVAEPSRVTVIGYTARVSNNPQLAVFPNNNLTVRSTHRVEVN